MPPNEKDIILPLMSVGSAFATEYYVDNQRFRAVVDTGSPFLLVDGSVTAGRERWGRYVADASGLPLNDVSEEGFGGQNVDVEWRRGSLRLAGYESPKTAFEPPSLLDRRRGARPGPWTVPSSRDALFEPINFGVVRSYEQIGGAGAMYLGLLKARAGRVRPTFLEQTDIRGLKFDFVGRTLTLAKRPLLRRASNAVPLVDLRPLGAPAGFYAIKVHRMLLNGAAMPLQRETVAIIDTGTTGMVVSDSLFDTDEMPLPGAAVRTATVEVLTERGQVVRLDARRARRRLEDLHQEEEPWRAPPPKAEDFPLIVTPVSLRWFDHQDLENAGTEAKGGTVSPAARTPHVLFLGLAFLSKLELTIDPDDLRLSATAIDV